MKEQEERVYLKKKEFVQALAKRNVNQKSLARTVGVTDNWISNIKSGRPVGDALRKKLMEFFEIDKSNFGMLFEFK